MRDNEEERMVKRVLIIEDSAAELAVMTELLREEDLQVDVAQSAQEGLRKARKMKPDLILLDLILPDSDGFEVCRQLKKESGLEKTLVVIVSIRDTVEDITKAFSVGADDYIIKPPVPEFLIKKIKLYLGNR
jgi:DNA-binding response OmpR family regulator